MSRTTTKIVIARSDGTIMGQYVLGLGEHIIGREIDSAIYIDDPHVSRSHARLIITEDAVEIEDLNSTSGTYLDGVTVRGRIPVEAAPFDKIIVTAAPPKIPEPLLDQLKPGGRMTIPVGVLSQKLLLIEKTPEGFNESMIFPVRFVPMTGTAQNEQS